MQAHSIAVAAVAALVFASFSPARAQSAAEGVRTRLEKWVETRHLISEESSDWKVERQTLRDTRKLLSQQKEALAAEIASLEESNTGADEERRELLLARGELQQAGTALEAQIRAMEKQVLALAPRLPEPLRRKLDLLLVQIPEDPETSDEQLGQRLMNVLGVLAQAERFDGTATFVGETRAVGDGPKEQVRTLYWGLGQAVFVDARGKSAGVGRPGPSGWEFSEEPRLVDSAERLLDIYEGNVDVIEFVEVPVEIR